MNALKTDLEQQRQAALRRRARRRLDDLAEIRAVVAAEGHGLGQKEIADLLFMSESAVRRLQRVVEHSPSVLNETPKELILRACVEQTPRSGLVEQLKTYTYTFGEEAPLPHEGRIPGTWDQVVVAFLEHFLSEEEFFEVRDAICFKFAP